MYDKKISNIKFDSTSKIDKLNNFACKSIANRFNFKIKDTNLNNSSLNNTSRSIRDNPILDRSQSNWLKGALAKSIYNSENTKTKDDYLFQKDSEKEERLKTLHTLLDQKQKKDIKGIVKGERSISP